MGVLDLFNSDLGKQIINGISQKTDISAGDTTSVVVTAIPALLGALQNNASTSEGAEGILGALTSKHNGNILDNVSGFLSSGGDKTDGTGILNHIFGNKLNSVENGISEKTGVSAGNVSQILIMLAPVIMGYLGKQAKSENITNSSGVTNLLGNLLGGTSGNSILTSILDQNGDGKLGLDDLVGLFSGNKKEGGLGGLLGKFLGK